MRKHKVISPKDWQRHKFLRKQKSRNIYKPHWEQREEKEVQVLPGKLYDKFESKIPDYVFSFEYTFTDQEREDLLRERYREQYDRAIQKMQEGKATSVDRHFVLERYSSLIGRER